VVLAVPKEKRKPTAPRLRSLEEADGLGPNAALRIDLTNNLLAKKSESPAEAQEITARQLVQCIQALPLHILFLICSAITVGSAAAPFITRAEQLIWQVLAGIPVLMFGMVLWRNARKPTANPLNHIRVLEVAGLLEGVAWAFPLALFLPVVGHAGQTIIIGISLAVAGVGALALSRVPVGAIVLSCLLVGSASRAIYLHISDASLIPPLLCAIYGIVLMGIVLSMHWDFLRRTRAEMENERQKQVISLLLNDFERGTSDWLWETDAEARLTYFSARFAEVVGRPDAALTGKTYREIATPSSEHQGWADFETAMVRQQDIPGQLLTHEHEGAPVHWQMTARPLFNEDNRFLGYRGVGRDISEKW
jgi:two-component system, sensor histidine kinase